MHIESINIMRDYFHGLKRLIKQRPIRVLDVGSKIIGENSSYRSLIDEDFSYTGLDIEPGNNVDIVVNQYDWRMSNQYDLIISGQAFEHIEFPWLTIVEMHNALVSGGYAVIIVPTTPVIHRFPVDCWRILPDGLIALAKWANFEVIDANMHQNSGQWSDAYCLLRKREEKIKPKYIEMQKSGYREAADKMGWDVPAEFLPESKGNVSFDGSGRVSVSVASIVGSARVQEQVRAVRAIEESQGAREPRLPEEPGDSIS